MSENREDLFKSASAKRKEDEAKANRPQTQFEEIHYLPFAINKQMGWKQFRVLGNPLDGRKDDPFSPKVVSIAWVVADDGSYMRVTYPTKAENPNWIMYKILNKVLKYTYDANSKSRTYHHANLPIFRRLNTNDTGDPRNKGWEPNKLVIMNVIDRSQMAWHKENKHTVLLSKNRNIKDEKVFHDAGVAQAFYDQLWNDVVEYAGDWHNYDIVAKRLPEDPWYKVLHAVEDYKKFANDLNTFPYNAETAGAPLTQEEMSWERYNIDNLFKPTSYKRLLNKLNAGILMVDQSFKTNFLDELKALAEIEEKNAPKEERDSESIPDLPMGNSAPAIDPPAYEVAPPPAPAIESSAPLFEATPAPAPMTRTVVHQGIDWSALEAQGYIGVPFLKQEAKDDVAGIKPDGSFMWKTGPLYECPKCKFQAPQVANVCPKCNAKFE